MLNRRKFLAAGGLAIAGPAVTDRARPAGLVEIPMKNDASRVHAWFDPIGVLVTPGQTVRWILDLDVHATAAYH
jgi:plastocyanin